MKKKGKKTNNINEKTIKILTELAALTIGCNLQPVKPSDEPYGSITIPGGKPEDYTPPVVNRRTLTPPTEEEIEKTKSLLKERNFGDENYLENWSYKKDVDKGTIIARSPQRSWNCLYGREVEVNLQEKSLRLLSMS